MIKFVQEKKAKEHFFVYVLNQFLVWFWTTEEPQQSELSGLAFKVQISDFWDEADMVLNYSALSLLVCLMNFVSLSEDTSSNVPAQLARAAGGAGRGGIPRRSALINSSINTGGGSSTFAGSFRVGSWFRFGVCPTQENSLRWRSIYQSTKNREIANSIVPERQNSIK